MRVRDADLPRATGVGMLLPKNSTPLTVAVEPDVALVPPILKLTMTVFVTDDVGNGRAPEA